jgi:hypothetical protein
MKTPVSASNPMRAIMPTQTAIETLNFRIKRNQTAPTRENGTASMTMPALTGDLVFI